MSNAAISPVQLRRLQLALRDPAMLCPVCGTRCYRRMGAHCLVCSASLDWQQWMACVSCSHPHRLPAVECVRCGKGLEPAWLCPGCQGWMGKSTTECRRCGTLRPGVTPHAQPVASTKPSRTSQPAPPDFCLQAAGGVLPLYLGRDVAERALPGLGAADRPLARLVSPPQQPATRLLLNLSGRLWKIALPDGRLDQVAPRHSCVVCDGLRIDFGGGSVDVRATLVSVSRTVVERLTRELYEAARTGRLSTENFAQLRTAAVVSDARRQSWIYLPAQAAWRRLESGRWLAESPPETVIAPAWVLNCLADIARTGKTSQPDVARRFPPNQP